MSTCEPKKSEIARADNRAAFPHMAAIVDEFKKYFGDDQVRLIYAEEGGRSVGKKLPKAQYFLTVNQWLKMSEKLDLIEVKR